MLVVAVVVGLVFLLSSGGSPKPKKQATGKQATTASTKAGSTTTTTAVPAAAPTCPPATPQGAPKRVVEFTKAPPTCISPTGVYDARVVTDVGTFVIRMDARASLAAVNNFVFLARYHFFDGTTFLRVIQDFVVQGGSPNDTGSGGPGYSFTGNTPPKSCTAAKDCYPVWGVAMANSSGPSTDGSQFFIVLPGGQKILDQEPHYTLFGQVVLGRSVVAAIGRGGAPPGNQAGTPRVVHRILKVTISQVAS